MRNKEALPCVRRYSWRVQAAAGGTFFSRNTLARPMGPSRQGGNVFFREIRWPVRWVPAVRWRNNYSALPCSHRGHICQPLHVQYSSDGSPSLTMLTTPRREHQGGGQWRGLGRGRHGAGEDAAVEARAERSTRVHWFSCSVRLPSPQNNRGCG